MQQANTCVLAYTPALQVQICISYSKIYLVNSISHVLCFVNVFMLFINISQKIMSLEMSECYSMFTVGLNRNTVYGCLLYCERCLAREMLTICLAREDIACDVDEILWPDPNTRQDP